MAEFQEVMRQYGRMCTAHAGCFNCPLHGPDGVSDRCNIVAFVNDSECIEREIMKWATEHQEPSYPTWMEWLTGVRAIPKAASWDESLVYDALQKHVPADIAEKLGIEPKKVTNDG